MTTTTALPRNDTPPPSALDAWTLPGVDGLKIGEPCPPPHENAPAAGVVTPCGTAGKVSLEYQSYRPLVGEPPCEMRSLDGKPQTFETRACVDGDHAVFSSVCMICRSMSGWSAHARLSELAPDQSRALYARIGYGTTTDAAPTTPAAWRALIEKGEPIERAPTVPTP